MVKFIDISFKQTNIIYEENFERGVKWKKKI